MLSKAKKLLACIDETIFSACIILLTVLTVLAVIMRYVVNSPFMWIEEAQMILVVWAAFFGGSIAFRERGHISVELLFEKLPNVAQRIMNTLIWIITAASIAWIGNLQMQRALKMFATKQFTTMLHFPRYIVYAVVVFACFLMLINHLICGIEDFLKHRGGPENE